MLESELTLMTLSRFRILQEGRHLTISLIRNLCQDFFKTLNRWSLQTLLLLILFQQLTAVRAYQNDYVIDNYVEPAVI